MQTNKTAEAFLEWQLTDRGAACSAVDTLTGKDAQKYLGNRLREAFYAGAALNQPAGEPEWVKWHECAPTGEGWYLTYWSDGSLETYHIETLDLNKHSINCGPAALTHWAPLPAAPEVDNAEGQQA